VAKWPGLEHKLYVIPHGIASEYLDPNASPTKSALQDGLGTAPYVVYLGGPAARKRFDWAVKVLEASDMPALQLVVVGFGAGSRAAAMNSVPSQLRARVHFAPFLADDELRALYQGAVAVLYPTLYEGFGFPAVEAQAAGTTAIFSAVSSLSELVGPLARVVEPHDLPAWCHAVREAMSLAPAARSTLAADARAWAQRFSWQRSFAAHLDVYRRAAAT
jgi:alpha-1,3-rhamnosyl/mannosyltransferase